MALLAAYAALFALHDPRGTLGSDEGGKLATLRAMGDGGSPDPDVGYWAGGVDHDGSLHPLYYARQIDDQWVDVTTLPMLVAAWPLYEVGGISAAMFVPMLGAVMCALAASLLAMRLDRRGRWPAFWVVGLATPLALYATDFWEHAPGLALLLGATIACYDVALREATCRAALGAGLCFGAAASMRTEALVYLVVAVVVVVTARGFGRDRRAGSLLLGVVVCAGAAVALLANIALETLLLGDSMRAGRTAAAAADAGSTILNRAKEAVITSFGLNAFDFTRDVFVGALLVGLLVVAIVAMSRSDDAGWRLGTVALVAAGFLYAVRFAHGVGFVPGLLTASPFAVAGLALGWSTRASRFLLALALLPLPVVWATQYPGGALPQWGGRYILLSGALLAVVGVAALVRAGRAFVGVLSLAVLVTGFGVVFAQARSHAVADAMTVVASSPHPVIAREGHLLREGGAFYDAHREWLTATTRSSLRRATRIVAARDDEFELLQFAGRPVISHLDGFTRRRVRSIEFVPGVRLDIVTYSSP